MKKEKLWEECSKEEKAEYRKLEKRKEKLMKIIELGFLTKAGEEYFKKDLDNEVQKLERKWRRKKQTAETA